MARNDALLYSGMTSPARREAVKAKEEVTKLDARAEAVLDLLANDKKKLADITSTLTSSQISTEEKLHALERQADQYSYLTSLERRMKQLLGIKPMKGES